MTASVPVLDADQVCPYLGLADDRATHYASASSLHRCYAARRPDKIESPKQARDCLTALHVECPRYHPPVVPPPSARPPGGAPASPSSGPVRLVAGTSRRLPTIAAPGLPPARRVGEIALVALLLVGAAAAGLLGLGSRPAAPASAAPGSAAAGAGASTPAAVPSALASPSDPVTPSPATPSPSPSDPATPSPTATLPASPVPTARPVPTPSPVVYVVRPGDTLTSIASRYRVSVAALKAANRSANPSLLTKPNLIFAGQRIVIPAS